VAITGIHSDDGTLVNFQRLIQFLLKDNPCPAKNVRLLIKPLLLPHIEGRNIEGLNLRNPEINILRIRTQILNKI
jgi:hypothetical protein